MAMNKKRVLNELLNQWLREGDQMADGFDEEPFYLFFWGGGATLFQCQSTERKPAKVLYGKTF